MYNADKLINPLILRCRHTSVSRIIVPVPAHQLSYCGLDSESAFVFS